MQVVHKQIAREIKRKNKNIAINANKKRKNRPQLKERDKVYLLTKNIKSKRPSKKLDHVKVRLFLIKQQKGLVNYELDLPRDTNIHPVFYVSLLELVDTQTPLQETFYFKNKAEYKVERILAKKGQKYLVRQKGYGDTEDTQEPLRNLRKCIALVRHFHQEEKVGKTS